MKHLKNLGTILSKTDQKEVFGGNLVLEPSPGEEPCNGCPVDLANQCCITDSPCEPTSVITANGWPSCTPILPF